MRQSLSGKVALITGGARGVGAATALRLVEQGALVHVADLDPIDVGETPGLARLSIASHRLDVGDHRSWTDLISRIYREEGRLDILHLNAGIQARPFGVVPSDDPLSWFDEPICDRLITVNIKGVTNGIMAALPLLRESRGSIIVTASMAGVRGFEADPLYAMTKFAVVGLVRSLGPRLARDDVCINAICPGGVDTRMIASASREAAMDFIKPAHVAALVSQLVGRRDFGGIWLTPLDGTIRRFEIDPLEHTDAGRMRLSDLARA
ncbi:SDR family NAD(P)-dependent oxidoreductase [Sphingobium mellinum]|uniref:SDR family NAD(P)-dependent oxidoreductase n=1 Tax=Sphingobium mellinum TaxID=1387166 RepID=UPI0030EC1BD6